MNKPTKISANHLYPFHKCDTIVSPHSYRILNISNIQLFWIIIFVGYHKRTCSNNNLLYNDFVKSLWFHYVVQLSRFWNRYDSSNRHYNVVVDIKWINTITNLKYNSIRRFIDNCNTMIKWAAWNPSHDYRCRFPYENVVIADGLFNVLERFFFRIYLIPTAQYLLQMLWVV